MGTLEKAYAAAGVATELAKQEPCMDAIKQSLNTEPEGNAIAMDDFFKAIEESQ